MGIARIARALKDLGSPWEAVGVPQHSRTNPGSPSCPTPDKIRAIRGHSGSLSSRHRAPPWGWASTRTGCQPPAEGQDPIQSVQTGSDMPRVVWFSSGYIISTTTGLGTALRCTSIGSGSVLRALAGRKAKTLMRWVCESWRKQVKCPPCPWQ